MAKMLVTGGSGVVGTELVRRAKAAGWVVTACSRRGCRGTVRWNMGQERPPKELRRQWDVVVHSAATTQWTLPADQAWAANVDSTRAVREVMPAGAHLVLISTAYVGAAEPGKHPVPADFRNTYEWSKACSESAAADITGRITIIRPPIVIGSREDGSVARFSGLYQMLQAITAGHAAALVAAEGARLEIVSTTDVASAVLAAAHRGPPPAPETEILGRGTKARTIRELLGTCVEELSRWRRQHGVPEVAVPPLVDPEQWQRFYRPFARKHLTGHQFRVLELLEPFIPYLSITEPMPVTRLVSDLDDCVRRCVRYWARTRPAASLRVPAIWSAATRVPS